MSARVVATPAGRLCPGVVVDWSDDLWLVVSQQTPAGSVPRPEADGLCEPRLVKLAYLRDDRWVQTHECTYMCFGLDELVSTNDAVRVQVPARTGRFLDESARVSLMSRPT